MMARITGAHEHDARSSGFVVCFLCGDESWLANLQRNAAQGERMTHLTFHELAVRERKTKVWEVRGYQDAFLGTVAWRSGWRQYVFEPQRSDATVWSHDCLAELAAFIKRVMNERKKVVA